MFAREDGGGVFVLLVLFRIWKPGEHEVIFVVVVALRDVDPMSATSERSGAESFLAHGVEGSIDALPRPYLTGAFRLKDYVSVGRPWSFRSDFKSWEPFDGVIVIFYMEVSSSERDKGSF
jgi:hypothetical protein